MGSLMNALSSVLLLIVVTRTLGAYMGGIFSLAFALGQQFQSLGAFEVRPFQATDTSQKYSFGIYLSSRIFTCVLMVASLAAYSLYSNGLTTDALLLFCIAGLKVFDAFEDVYHGLFQQHGRLDLAGKAFFLRSFLTFVGFSAGCLIAKSLFIACVVSILVSLTSVVFLNIPKAHLFERNRPSLEWSRIIQLLIACLPLFLATFFANDILNVPRYGIEACLSKDMQAIYAIIFMPAMVINLLVGFFFKPLLTSLAEKWNSGDIGAFGRTISRGLLLAFAITAVAALFAWPFGIPILELFYGVDLEGYQSCLMVILIGGCFNSLSVVLYYCLVTMRLQRLVVVGYGVACAVAHLLSGVLISSMGIMGAIVLYDASMLVVSGLFALFSVFGVLFCKKDV